MSVWEKLNPMLWYSMWFHLAPELASIESKNGAYSDQNKLGVERKWPNLVVFKISFCSGSLPSKKSYSKAKYGNSSSKAGLGPRGSSGKMLDALGWKCPPNFSVTLSATFVPRPQKQKRVWKTA